MNIILFTYIFNHSNSEAETILGVDLGTTYSCIAILENENPRVIENLEGERTTSTSVSLMDDGTKAIGTSSKRQLITNPKNTFYCVKKLLGRKFDDPVVKELSNRALFKIIKGPNGFAYIQDGSGKTYSPQEILSYILSKLKENAENHLGKPVTKTVATIPASYNDTQKKAVKETFKLAGLEVLSFVNEPTAAAIAFYHDSPTPVNKTIALYDLGGAAFDMTVMKISNGNYDILASGGIDFLGGDDFNQRIQDHLIQYFKEQTNIDLSKEVFAVQRISEASDRAKYELSTAFNSDINLPYITADATGPKHLSYRLSRAKADSLTSDIVERTFEVCQKVIDEAGITKNDLDEILLIGGSTKAPYVRSHVEKFFGKPLNKEVPPDEALAIGAALHASLLVSEGGGIAQELELTNHSVGIESANDTMVTLIPANSRIPIRKTKVISTSRDNQTELEIRVLQGESKKASENKLIGKLVLKGIPKLPKGVPRINVSFDFDSNKVLRVSAFDETGIGRGIYIDPIEVDF